MDVLQGNFGLFVGLRDNPLGILNIKEYAEDFNQIAGVLGQRPTLGFSLLHIRGKQALNPKIYGTLIEVLGRTHERVFLEEIPDSVAREILTHLKDCKCVELKEVNLSHETLSLLANFEVVELRNCTCMDEPSRLQFQIYGQPGVFGRPASVVATKKKLRRLYLGVKETKQAVELLQSLAQIIDSVDTLQFRMQPRGFRTTLALPFDVQYNYTRAEMDVPTEAIHHFANAQAAPLELELLSIVPEQMYDALDKLIECQGISKMSCYWDEWIGSEEIDMIEKENSRIVQKVLPKSTPQKHPYEVSVRASQPDGSQGRGGASEVADCKKHIYG